MAGQGEVLAGMKTFKGSLPQWASNVLELMLHPGSITPLHKENLSSFVNVLAIASISNLRFDLRLIVIGLID